MVEQESKRRAREIIIKNKRDTGGASGTEGGDIDAGKCGACVVLAMISVLFSIGVDVVVLAFSAK